MSEEPLRYAAKKGCRRDRKSELGGRMSLNYFLPGVALRAYAVEKILPGYNSFSDGHDRRHVRMVIRECL